MSIESDIEIEELKNEAKKLSSSNKKGWVMLACLVVGMALFIIPQVVWIETVKTALVDTGEQHTEIFEVFNDLMSDDQAASVQVRERFDQLRSENPNVASDAMFFWLQTSYMESLEDSGARQDIVNDAFDSLMPAQFNQFLIYALKDDEKELVVNGSAFDAEACLSELNTRHSMIKEQAYDGWNPLGVFWYLNEIGFHGWGVDYCQPLQKALSA